MAAFKSFVNKIVINITGQCYRIRNQKRMEELERTWSASFHGTLHKCVSTMAALFQNQIKVKNMKMYT